MRLLFGGGFFALLLLAFGPYAAWDGAANRRIEFTVCDNNGKPIEGAQIWLMERSAAADKAFIDVHLEGEESELRLQQLYELGLIVESDLSGIATVQGVFGAGGSSTIFVRSGSYRVDQEVVISADGFGDETFYLPNLLGKVKFPLSEDDLEAKVFLRRKPPNSAL